MLDAEGWNKGGEYCWRDGAIIFNAVFRKGLTEKKEFRKDLKKVKELAFAIKPQRKTMLGYVPAGQCGGKRMNEGKSKAGAVPRT